MTRRRHLALAALTALALAALPVGCASESACTPEVHCVLGPDGVAACEDGYHFRGAPPDDYVCVPDDACDTCGARPAECADGGTLTTYQPAGCADGACQYTETAVPCSMGCVDGACTGCDNDCASVGEAVCADGAVARCEADADGCLGLSVPIGCGSGACFDDATCAGCEDACDVGATRCEAGVLRACETGADGCGAFGEGTACATGRCASPASCLELPSPMTGTLCSIDGWCWATPLPSGNALAGVSAAGETVFVVGTGGTLMRHDGADWIVEVAVDNAAFNDVFALAADDVWAVGDDGAIRHFDGSAWNAVASGTQMDLHGVWGSGPNDVWAVGVDVILRYDGSVWRPVSSGVTPLTLHAVFGTGPDDVWAVGHGYGGSYLHYDGAAWSLGYSDRFSGYLTVHDVWASGPDDYWAIGTGGRLLHYTGGEAWAETVRADLASMRAVFGTSATDVWMVGEGAAWHYDGAAWTEAADPGERALVGLTVDAAGARWAVGEGGVVLRDSGAGWSSMAGLTGPSRDYSSVWARTPTDVYALSDGGFSHFDGAAWTHDIAVPYTIHATTTGPSHLYAVATADSGGSPAIVRFDGATWSEVVAVDRADTEIVVVAEDDIWTFDAFAGGVRHYDGVGYEADPFWGAGSVYGLHGSAPDDVWAVGTDSSTYHYDGSGWERRFSQYHGDWLDAVWSSGPGDLWAAGSDGLIQRWDGTHFSNLRNPTWKWTERFYGTGPDDVFLMAGYAGETESVAHYDGHEWREHVTGAGVRLRDLAGDEDMVWMVGHTGAILYRAAPPCGPSDACGCAGETEAALCASLSYECGRWVTVDGCGRERVIDCGGCASGACGAASTAGRCESPPSPVIACGSEDLSGFASSAGVVGTGTLASFVPLCGGGVLLADTDASAVIHVDMAGGGEIARYPLASAPAEMYLDLASGNLFVSLAPASTLVRVDLATGIQTSIALSAAPMSISRGEPGELFVSLEGGAYYRSRPIAVVDIASASVLTTISGSGDGDGPGFESHIAYDPTTRLLTSASGEVNPGMIVSYLYDARRRRLLEREIARDVGSGVCELDMSSDGRHLAYSCGAGNGAGYSIIDFDPAHLIDSVNGRTLTEFEVGAYPGSVHFSRDGTRLLVENGAMMVFDVATRAEVARHSTATLGCGSSSDHRTTRWSLGGGLVFLHGDCALGADANRLVWARAD